MERPHSPSFHRWVEPTYVLEVRYIHSGKRKLSSLLIPNLRFLPSPQTRKRFLPSSQKGRDFNLLNLWLNIKRIWLLNNLLKNTFLGFLFHCASGQFHSSAHGWLPGLIFWTEYISLHYQHMWQITNLTHQNALECNVPVTEGHLKFSKLSPYSYCRSKKLWRGRDGARAHFVPRICIRFCHCCSSNPRKFGPTSVCFILHKTFFKLKF